MAESARLRGSSSLLFHRCAGSRSALNFAHEAPEVTLQLPGSQAWHRARVLNIVNIMLWPGTLHNYRKALGKFLLCGSCQERATRSTNQRQGRKPGNRASSRVARIQSNPVPCSAPLMSWSNAVSAHTFASTCSACSRTLGIVGRDGVAAYRRSIVGADGRSRDVVQRRDEDGAVAASSAARKARRARAVELVSVAACAGRVLQQRDTGTLS